MLFIAILAGFTTAASGQQPGDVTESERTEIHTILRRFYFNLDHKDWEALTSDILAAKVMAHRPVPDSLIQALERKASADPGNSEACRSKAAVVENAALTRTQDWVQVVVPRCGSGSDDADRFRLVRLESRWRFIHIQLARQPPNFTTGTSAGR